MLGLLAAQHLADAVIDRRVGGMVLAIHLEIDAQRRPARAEVGLPLQLHAPAGDRQRLLVAILVVKGDGARHRVDVLDRHIKHAARLRADRQEAGIGLLPLLAQRGQHDRHDRVIPLRRPQQDRVHLAGLVILGRAGEFVLEPEGIEEPAQHRVVVVAEAREFPERVGHRGQRALQMLAQHGRVRHVFGHLAHSVHVVREHQQLRRQLRDFLKRAPDHRGPRHFAEGADMRQARGPVAGLEQHIALFGRRLFVPFQHTARLFEGPGFRGHRGVAKSGHGRIPGSVGRAPCPATPVSYCPHPRASIFCTATNAGRTDR